MKPNAKPESKTVTDDMIADAKPAVFTGCWFNQETGKVKMVCWPGVKFPGQRHVIVLERRDCKSSAEALALATERLEAERRKLIAPKKREAPSPHRSEIHR